MTHQDKVRNPIDKMKKTMEERR
jgi:hypothetical protein